MPDILLVDDDAELCALLKDYFHSEGLSADAVSSGQEALTRLAAENVNGVNPMPDVIVLDIMMPGITGLETLQKLRAHQNPLLSHIPIIMLTGRGDDIDRIVGLEMGADDYLGKPCHPRELLARIRAILRRVDRSANQAQKPRVMLKCRDVALDTATLSAKYQGQLLALTSAELNVLKVLLEYAGQVVTKEVLTEQALNRKLTAHDRSIDVHVSRVRHKLKLAGADAGLIQSVRGVGYQFINE